MKANDYTNMYKCQTHGLLVMNYELKFKVNEMKTYVNEWNKGLLFYL